VSEQGGDAACWADQVCDRCGMLVEPGATHECVRGQLYDDIGTVYARHRRADPRIAAQIRAALGDARTVVNVGAGPGSYEFDDLDFVAVEPSTIMLAQRVSGAAPAVQAVAEYLPFPSLSFDAALAVFTVHHWAHLEQGLQELCRAAPRRVVLCFDLRLEHELWLVTEYLPEFLQFEEGLVWNPEDIAAAIGAERIEVVPVPHDCQDGFGGAYWRRPERYLDRDVQACISSLARLEPAVLQRFETELRRDLDSGAWHARHRDLLALTEIDLGYRLVVAS